MNKLFIFTTLTAAVLLTGCDKFKPKDKVEETDAAVVAEWSCTNQDNLNNIQAALKKAYLKQIERSLRDSEYQADYTILDTINKGLKFEIKNVRTLDASETEQTSKTLLSCESQLVVSFPQGLQKRAENAYLEEQKYQHDGEDEDPRTYTLSDYFSDGDYPLTLENDQLRGEFSYNLTKTDKDGLVFNIPDQNSVIDGVVFMATKAVQYVAYLKQNRLMEQSSEQAQKEYDAESSAQMDLAQKAMDIRKKELDAEKSKQVERLNQTWDKFSRSKRHNCSKIRQIGLKSVMLTVRCCHRKMYMTFLKKIVRLIRNNPAIGMMQCVSKTKSCSTLNALRNVLSSALSI